MYSAIVIIIMLIFFISFIPWILFIFFIIRSLRKQFNNIDSVSYELAKKSKTTFNLLNFNFYNLRSSKIPLYSENSSIYWNVFIYREPYVYSKKVRTTDYTVQFDWSRYDIQNRIMIIENRSALIKIFSRIIKRLCKSMFFLIFISLWLMFTPLGYVFFYMSMPSLIILMISSLIILIISSILFGKYWILWNIYDSIERQEMESLWFEKSFDAFSKDPVEARMIITTAFMDRLEQFSEKWNLKGKIRIIWEKDTFTLMLKWDIEKYGKENDGSYTLIKSMEEILNLSYYSLNTNNQ